MILLPVFFIGGFCASFGFSHGNVFLGILGIALIVVGFVLGHKLDNHR